MLKLWAFLLHPTLSPLKNAFLGGTRVVQRFSATFDPGHDPGVPGSSPAPGSMRGARCGTRSRVPGVTPSAKGGRPTAEPPGLYYQHLDARITSRPRFHCQGFRPEYRPWVVAHNAQAIPGPALPLGLQMLSLLPQSRQHPDTPLQGQPAGMPDEVWRQHDSFSPQGSAAADPSTPFMPRPAGSPLGLP